MRERDGFAAGHAPIDPRLGQAVEDMTRTLAAQQIASGRRLTQQKLVRILNR